MTLLRHNAATVTTVTMKVYQAFFYSPGRKALVPGFDFPKWQEGTWRVRDAVMVVMESTTNC